MTTQKTMKERATTSSSWESIFEDHLSFPDKANRKLKSLFVKSRGGFLSKSILYSLTEENQVEGFRQKLLSHKEFKIKMGVDMGTDMSSNKYNPSVMFVKEQDYSSYSLSEDSHKIIPIDANGEVIGICIPESQEKDWGSGIISGGGSRPIYPKMTSQLQKSWLNYEIDINDFLALNKAGEVVPVEYYTFDMHQNLKEKFLPQSDSELKEIIEGIKWVAVSCGINMNVDAGYPAFAPIVMAGIVLPNDTHARMRGLAIDDKSRGEEKSKFFNDDVVAEKVLYMEEIASPCPPTCN